MLIKTNSINFHAFTIVELLVAITIFYIILCFIVPEIKNGPCYHTTPQKENLKNIKKAIDQYYADNGRYPKYLIDLTKTKPPYFFEVPVDPLTGTADWEVAEKDKKTTWYRTSDITYPNAPPQWLPTRESSIYHVRPRNINN